MSLAWDYEANACSKDGKFSAKFEGYELAMGAPTLGELRLFVNSEHYLNLKNENGRGLNYIYCYGIISLAETEAHAIKVIYKILLNKDLDIASIPDLDIVRLLRNKIFAHPVDLSQRHGKQGFGIVASYLSTFSFSPYSFESDKYEDGNGLSLYEKVKNLASNKTNYNALIIDIKELIEKQQIILCKKLKEIETEYQL